VKIRQVNIQDNQIRIEFCNQLNSLSAIGGVVEINGQCP
jgi:hypothetical protein